MRILWANVYCLLDTSSGASMSARQMLLQLKAQGHEVMVLGATVFDSDRGTTPLKPHWQEIQSKRGHFVELKDGDLSHKMLVTASTQRAQMTSHEEGLWMASYQKALESFRPDIVFFYGGQSFDWLIACEARAAGARVVAYLVNGNYGGQRWCKDVDQIVTDSQATADFYKQHHGYSVQAVGTFIDPARVRAAKPAPRRILFVNPSREKGAGVVVQLAMLFEKTRPDIIFEVVQSRGDWGQMVRSVTQAIEGSARESLTNVVVSPNTADMRPIYGRTRLLLAPSLWWESGARVLAEAMLNGIPAIVTRRGGSPEMVGNAGLFLEMPEECHQKPYDKLPSLDSLQPLADRIVELYDDEGKYKVYVERAREVAAQRHDLEHNGRRLAQVFENLMKTPVSAPVAAASQVAAEVSWREVCRHLDLFAPNSAGWTGGYRALAQLARESAQGTMQALQALAQQQGSIKRAAIEITPIEAWPQTKTSAKLAAKLEQLFKAHGSDKSTVHNYHLLYAAILDAHASRAFNMLEIGMGTNHVDTPSNMGRKGRPGASLRAFRDCFAKASVYGADVDDRILFQEDRIVTHVVDQTRMDSFDQLAQWLAPSMQLIIDDGLHAPHSNLNTVLFALRKLGSGGWLVVEDILPAMLPVWRLALSLMPEAGDTYLVQTRSALVFVLRKH